MSNTGTPDQEWAPLYWTKPLGDELITRGDDVIDVAETFMVMNRGFRAGEPLRLTPWQKWLIRAIYEERPDGRLRYRTVVVGLPRKNGKSLGVAAPFVLERLIFGGSGSSIASLGAVLKNAKIIYDTVSSQVERNNFLSRHIKVRHDGMKSRFGATYEMVAADKSSRIQGQSYELITIDEFHEFLTDKQIGSYDTATSGQGDRDESMVIITSTAGQNLETKFGELYQTGIKAANGQLDDDSIGFFWWGATTEDDPTDPATWRKANPNLVEGLLDEDYFRSQLAKYDAAGNLNGFLRYHLNIWSRTEGEEYISPYHWEQAKDEDAYIPKGARIAVGFDGSLDNDSTAFVGIDVDTGVIEVLAAWHKDPNDPNWVVPRDEVLAAKDRIFEEYDVLTLYADTAYWKTEIQEWSYEHYPRVLNLKQGTRRLAEIYADLKKEIVSKELKHNGDKKLAEHVQNAVMKRTGVIGKESWKSPKKIDLCVATAFAAEARRTALDWYAEDEEDNSGEGVNYF